MTTKRIQNGGPVDNRALGKIQKPVPGSNQSINLVKDAPLRPPIHMGGQGAHGPFWSGERDVVAGPAVEAKITHVSNNGN